MSKNVCELCTKPATMFCESDEASLCWGCDHKVHAANFLVAKHSRTLLCNVCHSPTPWKASGLNIGPTLSLCHACSAHAVKTTHKEEDDGGSDSQESESDDGEYYSEEEDTVNQVVPWTDSGFKAASKRRRQNSFQSGDEDVCCSSQNLDLNLQWDEDSNSCSSSPSIAIVEKLRRFKRKL